MKRGQRLDERVVAEGLAETRSRAEALIRAGRVLVDDAPVEKPGTRVAEQARLRLRGVRGAARLHRLEARRFRPRCPRRFL